MDDPHNRLSASEFADGCSSLVSEEFIAMNASLASGLESDARYVLGLGRK